MTKKETKKVKAPIKPVKLERYFEALGGRKTAHARVRLFNKPVGIKVNDKDHKEYFKIPKHQAVVEAPLELMKMADRMGATVRVSGGGIGAQAEAIRHGLARALVLFNETYRKRLRQHDYMKRDPRMVERKKYGLKKARRAPQWAKR